MPPTGNAPEILNVAKLFVKILYMNKSIKYFLFLFWLIFISAKSQSQNDTSLIEQHCINFFANYIIGKVPELEDRKVYFDWISLPKQTFFYSTAIKYIFTSNPELNNDIHYGQYAESIEPVKIEYVYNPYFIEHKKDNSYTLTLFRKRKVGDYYYVLVNISFHLKGYFIYFQVRNIKEPLQYVLINYIY